MPDFAALLLIGFSVGAALILLLANLGGLGAELQSRTSRAAGVLLLVNLSAVQVLHADYVLHGGALFESRVYAALLYLQYPAFYLFFRGVVASDRTEGAAQLVHFAPLLLVPFVAGAIAIPLSFALGAVYSLHLAYLTHRLRDQRRNFRAERHAFAAFGAVALLILALGVGAPWLGARVYVLGYAALIGLAFTVVVYVLLRHPDVVEKTVEAVRNAYAVSTLGKVDRSDALARLERFMTNDRIYTNESLSLASLAQALELTPHQLSELINVSFGVGFSRYVRERRVAAAQRMLLDEPNASVLSIGLAVGFTSQSNFYTAFREISGTVPGQFRKDRAAV